MQARSLMGRASIAFVFAESQEGRTVPGLARHHEATLVAEASAFVAFTPVPFCPGVRGDAC